MQKAERPLFSHFISDFGLWAGFLLKISKYISYKKSEHTFTNAHIAAKTQKNHRSRKPLWEKRVEDFSFFHKKLFGKFGFISNKFVENLSAEKPFLRSFLGLKTN